MGLSHKQDRAAAAQQLAYAAREMIAVAVMGATEAAKYAALSQLETKAAIGAMRLAHLDAECAVAEALAAKATLATQKEEWRRPSAQRESPGRLAEDACGITEAMARWVAARERLAAVAKERASVAVAKARLTRLGREASNKDAEACNAETERAWRQHSEATKAVAYEEHAVSQARQLVAFEG